MYPFKFNFKITTPGSNWSLTPWNKNFIECHQEIRNKHEMTPNNCLPNHLHFSPKSLNPPNWCLEYTWPTLPCFFWVPIYFLSTQKWQFFPNLPLILCWPPMLCPSHRLAEPYSCLTIGNWDSHPPRSRPRRLARLAFLSIFCCCLMSWDVLYEIKVSDFSWGRWGKQYWGIAW